MGANGAGEAIDLLPMDVTLNLGAWKSMENEWADTLQLNKKVKVEIIPIYEGNSLRPNSFEIEYWIDDVYSFKQFNNYN